MRLAERRGVARQVGLRLADLRLKRPGIDGEQQIALLNGIAFMERDLGQLAAHLRFHGDGGVRFHVSDDVHVDGDIALGDHGHHDGNGSAIAGASASAGTAGLCI